MPTYKVTDPQTGRTVRLTGDSPPTEAELNEVFASIAQSSQEAIKPSAPSIKKPLTRRERRAEQAKSRQQDIAPNPFEGLPSDIVADIESRFPMPVDSERRRGQPRAQVANARRRAAELEKIRLINPFLAEQIEETGDVESFLVGAGRGLTTVGRGIGLADDEDATTTASIEGLRTQKPGAVGAGELAGETAPFLPAGLAAGSARSLLGRTLLSGGVGAAEGGILTSGKGGDTGEIIAGTLLGGLIGGGAELAIPVISRASRSVIKRLTGRDIAAINSSGGLTDEAIEALDDAGVDHGQFIRESIGESDLSQDQRVEVFEKLGLEPTKAQATRDPSLFQQQQESFKQTGVVREALERQDKILADRVAGEIDAIGGVPQRASETPLTAITDKAIALDEEISALYKSARDVAPDAKNVRFSKSSSVLREKTPIDTRTDGTVSALRDEMRRLGFLDEKNRPTRKTSVEAAESLRQFANSLFDGANPQAKTVIREFKEAIDEDVFSVAGEDIFKQARKAKSDFERGLDTTKRNKFDRRQVSLVRDMLDGSIQGDDLVKTIISRSGKYKAKDLKELRSYLLSGSDGQVAQGAQAWNDIRSAALNQIKESAFKGPIDQQGVRSISRAGLESGLRQLGPQKMQILFSQKERDFLKDLANVAALKEPPRGTALGLGPSAQAVAKLEQALKTIPWLGDFAADVLRNKADDKMLLKFASQAEIIAKQNEKRFQENIRKSMAGKALAASPLVAIPAIAEENNE